MTTTSTNPCGELPLPNLDSCRLTSLNLSSYVDNPFTPEAKFNERLFESHVSIAQKLMDDMIDLEIEAVTRIIKKVEHDPEPEDIKRNELELWKGVREKCEQGRRTGLGITGLGDCIAMLNQKYGSEESMKTVEYIYKNLRDFAYKASVQMAKDRGAFPLFDAKKEKDNEYLNRLPEEIKKEMWKVGRRNIGLLTTPPAGSLSSCTQTSSGFEPVFMAEYERKRKLHDNEKEKPDFVDAMGDKWKKYIVSHPKLKLFKDVTGKEYKDSPYFGALATEIDYMAKVKMQAIATSYVDHAISNTTNLPNDISIETVEKIYMLAWELGCKGVTIYREGSRDGVLTKIEAPQNTKECDDCDEASKKLKDLIQKGARPTKIYPSAAPKRENIIPCEIHRSKVRKGDWIFFVGLLNGQQPYEVFGGDSTKFTIPHKYKHGWIIKNGKNKSGITQYNLALGSLDDKDEKLEFKDINKHFNNKEFGAFTRMVSLHLRHGTPIKYICEQLTKTGCAGDLFSFQRAMSRILKKYIADGEKSEVECSICKSTDVYYKGGCPTCKVCGNSNCS
jgi:ribonucleoside-diphosphate reductase alpha chain